MFMYLLIFLGAVGEEDSLLHVAVEDLLYRRHVTFDDILHLVGHESEKMTRQMNAGCGADTNGMEVACQRRRRHLGCTKKPGVRGQAEAQSRFTVRPASEGHSDRRSHRSLWSPEKFSKQQQRGGGGGGAGVVSSAHERVDSLVS